MKLSGDPITPASMQKLKCVFAKIVSAEIVSLVNEIGFAKTSAKSGEYRKHPSYLESLDHLTPYQNPKPRKNTD